MLRSTRRTVLAALVTLAAACVPTNGAPTGDPTVITRDQLTAGNAYNTLYDAVLALHSNWLQTRGQDSVNSPTQVHVYLDNNPLGGVDALRSISPTSVSYVKHFDGVAATARWGLGNGAGVIYVSTNPAGNPNSPAKP